MVGAGLYSGSVRDNLCSYHVNNLEKERTAELTELSETSIKAKSL